MADENKPGTVSTAPAPPKPEETAPSVQGRSPNAAPTTDNPKEDIPKSAHASPGQTLTSQQFEGPKATDTPQPLANPGVAGGVKYPEPAYQPPPQSKTGASYRTTVPHYLAGDKYVEADTVLTEGVNIPFDWPVSMGVVPLNDAAKRKHKERFAEKPKSVNESLDAVANKKLPPGNQ